MRKASFVILGVAAVAMIAPSIAPAQPQQMHQSSCLPRDKIVSFLERQYGETLRGAGRQDPSGIMELYVSDNGTWTVIVTRPDGISCPVAVGDDWRQLDAPGAGGGKV